MPFIRLLLRRTYCSTSFPRAAGVSVKDFFRERNNRILCEKFKILCGREEIRNDNRIYEYTIRRLAAAGHFDWIAEIIEDQKKYIPISKGDFSAKLIVLCGKCGMFDHAQKLFDEMPQRGLWLFNALLRAGLYSKRFDEVNRLFMELPDKLRIKPDRASYNMVIKALCEMSCFDLVTMVLNQMEKNGMVPDRVIFNTLLHAFYKKGEFEDGEMIWHRMLEKNVFPDIVSYNARLHGFAKGSRLEEAVDLVREMRSKGVKPDAISFNALISGFVKDGNLEEAKKWYNELKKSNCLPNEMTFQLLLPFVCEKGDAEFAFELSLVILGRRFSRKRANKFDEALLQKVVDELVKYSNVEKARMLVQVAEANKYHQYRLELPSES